MRTLFSVLTAIIMIQAHAGEYATPQSRKERLPDALVRMQGFSERENSSDESDRNWWKEQTATKAAEVKSSDCEMTYLAEAAQPKSKFQDSLSKCAQYNLEEFPNKLTLKSIHSNSALMRHYYVLALLKTGNVKKAESEVNALDQFLDEKIKIENPDDQLEIVVVAFNMRIAALKAVSQALKTKNPKQSALLAANAKKRESLFTRIDTAHQKQEANSLEAQKQWAAGVRAKEAEMERERYDAKMEELRIHTENMKNKGQGGFDFQAEMEKSADGDSDSESGDCKCVVREQVWVAPKSASGMVKGNSGHYEFKDVKRNCPCT